MGNIRKLRRKGHLAAKEAAKDLARQAVLQHEEGIEFAMDELRPALDEVPAVERKEFKVVCRPYPTPNGHGTIVSIRHQEDGEAPTYHSDILIATKQDNFAVTDAAAATLVSFTTKALTLITDDEDGEADPYTFGFVLKQWSTNKAIGIQTAVFQ